MTNLLRLLYLLTIFFIGNINGQEAKILFHSDTILKLTIKMQVNEVIHDLKTRDEHEAILSYINNDNIASIHNIKIKVRGKSRSDVDVCRFPPLELNFKKNKTKNSLFEGQNKIKLVTHCNNEAEFKRYVLEEYMIYKMYQIVTPFSHHVRLCEITYVDIDNPKKHFTKVAFLIERIKDVADRNNMVVYKDAIPHQDYCNKKVLDKLTFFQYMIGNLDWEIILRHNIKLIAPLDGGFPIAIPYDFDYSGIINTSYAATPEGVGIEWTKTRLFRGFCRFNDAYKTTVDYYQKIEPDILSLIDNSDYLTERNKNSIERYLESFYEVLDDPKKINKKITRACRVKHEHLYENN